MSKDPKGYQSTFTGFGLMSYLTPFYGLRIDHIFVRSIDVEGNPLIRVTSYEVPDHKGENKRFVSDHRPVIVDLLVL